jgi:hypothetical protein
VGSARRLLTNSDCRFLWPGCAEGCPETLPVSRFVENFKLLQVRLAQMAGIPRDDQQRALVDSSATLAEIEVKIYLLSIVQAWNHRSFFSPSDRRVSLVQITCNLRTWSMSLPTLTRLLLFVHGGIILAVSS